MSDTQKSSSSPLIPILVVGALGFGIYKIVGKAKEVDNFLNNYGFSFKVGKPKLKYSFKVFPTGMDLPIDVIINNTSTITAEFEKPSLIIKYKGSELTRSVISTERVKINPKGNSTIPNIIFPISFTNSTFIQLVRDFVGKNLSISDIPTAVQNIMGNMRQVMKETQISGVVYVKKPIDTMIPIEPITLG